MANDQRPTLAAMEGKYTSGSRAELAIVGQPNTEEQRLENPIVVPYALSFLAYGSFGAIVQGLEDFPRETWPDNVELLYYAYHVMVGLGTLLTAVMFLGALLLWRGVLFRARPMLWAMLLAWPFPYVATTAGWMTAELGRQPWLVYGLVRTADGTSLNVGSGDVVFSTLGFMGLYMLLGLVFVMLVAQEIARGPRARAGEGLTRARRLLRHRRRDAHRLGGSRRVRLRRGRRAPDRGAHGRRARPRPRDDLAGLGRQRSVAGRRGRGPPALAFARLRGGDERDVSGAHRRALAIGLSRRLDRAPRPRRPPALARGVGHDVRAVVDGAGVRRGRRARQRGEGRTDRPDRVVPPRPVRDARRPGGGHRSVYGHSSGCSPRCCWPPTGPRTSLGRPTAASASGRPRWRRSRGARPYRSPSAPPSPRGSCATRCSRRSRGGPGLGRSRRRRSRASSSRFGPSPRAATAARSSPRRRSSRRFSWRPREGSIRRSSRRPSTRRTTSRPSGPRRATTASSWASSGGCRRSSSSSCIRNLFWLSRGRVTAADGDADHG